MKDKHRTATIQKFSLIEARHWWVSFKPEGVIRTQKFDKYKDARTHALKYVYAKNLIVYD
jgi:hypothetical protein